jgi:hypothetical protein
MPDLVERLRFLENSDEYIAARSLCREAADEIERLRAHQMAAERQMGVVPIKLKLREDRPVLDGQEAKKLRAAHEMLAKIVALHDYTNLDRGIGTALPEGRLWLHARELAK